MILNPERDILLKGHQRNMRGCSLPDFCGYRSLVDLQTYEYMSAFEKRSNNFINFKIYALLVKIARVK